jgi:hypothetical protein
MWTLGARFAGVIGVQLYLPIEGVRLANIPGALIVLALGATSRQTLRLRVNRNHRRLCATLVGCSARLGRVLWS